MHILNRRTFLTTAAAATTVSIMPRYSAASQQYAGERIRVFTYAGPWGDMFREHFAPGFADLTGAEILLDLGWWDSIPKLKASPPGQPAYDLIMTDATQGYPAIREGLFQKVDFDRIPNMKNFAPEMLDNWVVKEGWGVTWPDALGSGTFNKSLVGEPPQRWSDLLDPKYDNKIGLYDAFYMSLQTLAAIKVDSEGRAGSAYDEMNNNLEGVMQFAKEQSPRVSLWWKSASDMILNLMQGNVAIGNVHSPAIYQAMKDGEDSVAMFAPLEDRAFVQLFWLISKDTSKKEIAEAAIDYFCTEDFQDTYARNAGFVTPIRSVAERVTADDPLYGEINPTTPGEFAALKYFPYDAYFQNWDYIVETWDREVLRQS
jgi:spermidine/putrescine-binding protein